MGKYKSLQDDIFSVFGSNAWKAENILTIPDNFETPTAGADFIRVSIIAGRTNTVNIPRSVSGQLIIDIFTEAGKGTTAATLIADKLDKYLAGKYLSTGTNGNTQFGASSMSSLGLDRANPSLHRDTYSIPFNFFGIQ